MLFTKLRASTQTQTSTPSTSNNMFNTNTIMPINHIISRKKRKEPPKVVETPPSNSNERKMIWGEPFWTFFHILAEKIDENEFLNIRRDILAIIFNICSNLPCPDCTNHAKNYLNGVNFNNIRTKHDLKEMLFIFHNSVNVRRGVAVFPRRELDQKYKNGIFSKSLKIFLYFFQMKHNNVRLLNEDLYRQHIAKELQQWFQENTSKFH